MENKMVIRRKKIETTSGIKFSTYTVVVKNDSVAELHNEGQFTGTLFFDSETKRGWNFHFYPVPFDEHKLFLPRKDWYREE